MATTQPQPNNGTQGVHYAVYTKWTWTGEWVLEPYFEPLTATMAAAPGISTATFKMRYGSGKWEDLTAMKDGAQMKSYNYCYVQIRASRAGEESVLWTGLVYAETFQLAGQSGQIKTADQVIQAFGLEALLKNRLDGAWVKQAGGTEDDKVWIDHIPVFNRRHEFGGNILGNRSSGLTEELAYIFSAEDGEVWDNYAIAEYLLKYYQFENGPQFVLVGEEAITNAIEGLKGIYDFSQQTIFDCLNNLINRGRGFGWYVSVTKNNQDEEIVNIVPFSLLDEDIKLGEIVMPANPKRMVIDLWGEQRHTDVAVTSGVSNVYDKIIVQGARMKSCCSLHFDKLAETPHPSLEKGWSGEEETAYKDAAKNASGYGELEEEDKKDLNDIFRAEDRFERVFTTLRIPYNWDWIVGSGENAQRVNPLLSVIGVPDPETSAAYWNADKRLESSLPFKVGFDYSGTTPVDNNPAYAEPEFRRMFALVKDVDGRYQYAERLKPHAAAVRPLAREMGISIRFRPQYLASKNHWEGAEPADWEDKIEEYGIDYEDVYVTAVIETDQILKASFELNAYENQRILTINIPDAELWYVTPGTIIGADDEGALIAYGGTSSILRDDWERLEAALDAAIAWYGKLRNKITITIGEIDPGIPIGTLIENVDVADIGAIGSVVTELSWDFRPKAVSTAIITDYGELDITGIFRR